MFLPSLSTLKQRPRYALSIYTSFCKSDLASQSWDTSTFRTLVQRWSQIWSRASGPLAGRTTPPCVFESVQPNLHTRACVPAQRMQLHVHGLA